MAPTIASGPYFWRTSRQAVGHLVERLVPGDARPLALAAGARAAHGMEQAVGSVGDARRAADAFDAEGALGVGMVGVGREVDDLAVAHGRQRAAAGRALPAGGGIGAVRGLALGGGGVGGGHGAAPAIGRASLARGQAGGKSVPDPGRLDLLRRASYKPVLAENQRPGRNPHGRPFAVQEHHAPQGRARTRPAPSCSPSSRARSRCRPRRARPIPT